MKRFCKKLCGLFIIAILSIPLFLTPVHAATGEDVYIVKKRDSLYKISRKFGVSINELVELNSIENRDKIKEGQVLLIPKRKPFSVKSVTIKAQKQDPVVDQEAVITQPKRMAQEGTLEDPDIFPILMDEEIGYEEDIVVKKEKDPHREVLGGGITGWFAFIDTEVGADSGIIKGTKIDLQDTLGVDDDVSIPVVNVWFAPLSWLVFQWEYMEFNIKGSRVIDESITFSGVTFSGFDEVEGKADVQRVSGWIEINPIRGKWGYIGALVGGEYARIQAELSNFASGTVSGSITAPSGIPVVGGKSFSGSRSVSSFIEVDEEAQGGSVSLGGQAKFYLSDEIEFSLRGRGFSYEVSDIDFSFVDLQAEGSYTLFDLFKFAGGYRALFLDVEHKDFVGDLTLHGPYISGSLRF